MDKASGAAVDLIYLIIWFALLANEYNVICLVFIFLSAPVPLLDYFLILRFAFPAFQLLDVTAFGEADFWLALIKITGLVAFFFFAVIC